MLLELFSQDQQHDFIQIKILVGSDRLKGSRDNNTHSVQSPATIMADGNTVKIGRPSIVTTAIQNLMETSHLRRNLRSKPPICNGIHVALYS